MLELSESLLAGVDHKDRSYNFEDKTYSVLQLPTIFGIDQDKIV